ncbi:MAG: enoyl-CoA hydratase-related protein [Syntrophales bacterium]|nr:enoyl-CoA hydratase-related protein [Syntrophales bacterium]
MKEETMHYNNLIYQKTGSVATVTLNRPAAGNAVNLEMAGELSDICTAIAHDGDIKAVIITGAGEKAFSAGADPDELFEEGIMPSVAVPITWLTCPVIAAINGDALGQGLELALACDIRIAVETARFAMPCLASSFIPWDGATQRLPRLIGMAKAMEMFFTGQMVDAAEACRMGLINRGVSSGELLPLVTDICREMAAKSPLALQYAKEAIYKGMELTLGQGLRLEADLYFLLQTTEDRTEGIRAFLEKRPPQFKGM